MRISLAAALALTMLAACGDNGAPEAGEVPAELENDALKAELVTDETRGPVLAADLVIREMTPTLEFVWHAPPEIGAYPGALSIIKDEARSAQAEMRQSAREFAQMLAEQGQNPRPLSYQQDWTLSHETPGLLTLRSETYRYDGGAHGMTLFGSLFWDKQAGRAVELPQLFVTWPEARAEIARRFCRRLDEMRAERRGEPLGGEGEFTECPEFTDFPVIIEDAGGEPSLTVLVEPYAAGPYAEGSYEVTVALDGALEDAVKTAYLPAG